METLAAEVARNLGIPERSMRRAVDLGAVLGRRESPRKFMLSLGEEVYLRENWGMLSALRRALRTEPNIRLAVLFGSMARGTGGQESDLDILVTARDESRKTILASARRMSSRLQREVQLVPLADVEDSEGFLASVIDEGRVLSDRDGEWATLQSRRPDDEEIDPYRSVERLLRDD